MSGYERSDAHVGRLVAITAGLCAVVALVTVGVALMVRSFVDAAAAADRPRHALAADEPVPGPRLQENPARELAEHRVYEEARTATYGWVDRSRGIVRIPVERAMDLVAERGLPVRREEGR